MIAKSCITLIFLLSSLLTLSIQGIAQCVPEHCQIDNLPSGLVCFFPFTGGSLENAASNSYFLSNPNSALTAPDRFGNLDCAMYFNKYDNHYLLHENTPFIDPNQDFSISLWYHPYDSMNHGSLLELLIGHVNLNTDETITWGKNWYVALYDYRRSLSNVNGSFLWESFVPYPDDIYNWHHLLVKYDASDHMLSLFKNGMITTEEQHGNFASPQSIKDLVIGWGYTGLLDDIMVFDRLLDSTEIDLLLNLGSCCCCNQDSQTMTTVHLTDCNSVTYADSLITLPGSYFFNLPAQSGCDSLVEVIVNLLSFEPDSVFYESGCNRVMWRDSLFTESTVYTFEEFGDYDCLQRKTVHILITDIDTTLQISGNSLKISDTSMDVSWFDCLTGETIEQETSHIFNPSESGKYGAILSKNSCIDTTECIEVLITSTSSKSEFNNWQVFPNPTSEMIYISKRDTEIPFTSKSFKLTTTNIVGQKLSYDINLSSNILEFSIKNYAPGLYGLQLEDDKGLKIATWKIIKL